MESTSRFNTINFVKGLICVNVFCLLTCIIIGTYMVLLGHHNASIWALGEAAKDPNIEYPALSKSVFFAATLKTYFTIPGSILFIASLILLYNVIMLTKALKIKQDY
uniref:Uncharacterized protein n=1 Tax=Lepeophtheirus salmonis TaxID=72036 RepID=A0A0K2UGN6_LEPSM